MAQDSNPPLYFQCNLCGECCSSWNIPIEGHKAAQLLEKPWVQARLAETNRNLTDMGQGMHRIPLTDQNVCVFLADDKRCMVEVHEGLALKPHECQRFPFASTRMPDGSVRHESSAACKHISEKLLLAFQPILPKPASSLHRDAKGQLLEEETSLQSLRQQEAAQFDDITPFPKRVPKGLWGALSIAEYDAWQSGLRDIFNQPGIHPEAALKQAQLLLKSGPGSLDMQVFRFHPSIVWCLTLFFLRKPYRSMSWVSLLSGGHYHDPRLFGLPLHVKWQGAIPWNPEHHHRLNAFLYAMLQRKRLLSSGGSISTLLAMAAVACLLVQWYAKALAWLQQKNEIGDLDVSTAIRLVERYYTGHQPRFMAFFINRWQGWLVEKLLQG